jgi:TerC family integral membrane protein
LTAASLFPFAEYWWFYAAFMGFVLVLLLVDLGLFHREAHKVSFREATAWTVVWVTLALAFNFAFYHYMLARFASDARLLAIPGFSPEAAARNAALEFLAGYVVEYSLSVDNIFVFVVILNFFAVPSRHQHRVLFYGILGALVFRGAFIAAGAALLQLRFVTYLLGGFLIVTGIRLIFTSTDEEPPAENALIRLFRKYVPVTPELHGQRFFVAVDRKLHATPLFITLLFVEMTDIVFAMDSVPAIFALTREPLIVFTSNVLAILGLRSLYFMLRGALDRFYMLKYGLGVVLAFVGLKMVYLNDLYSGHFPIGLSLGIIVGTIVLAVALSLAFPKRQEEPRS